MANAAIVPAGTGGAIAVYPNNDTNLVSDINGYFAPAGTGGLSFYPIAPCRVIDTASGNRRLHGATHPPVDVAEQRLRDARSAQAYVFNATVVPNGSLGYLTLWPDGEDQPLGLDVECAGRRITSNMAYRAHLNGKVDAYASGRPIWCWISPATSLRRTRMQDGCPVLAIVRPGRDLSQSTAEFF